MTDQHVDIETLAKAFEAFTRGTETMEEAFRRLEARIRELDQELAEKNRELALTSDYLNDILESMSDGVIAVDTEGVVTTFNRAASDVLGYSAKEVVGQPFREMFKRDFAVPPGPQVMELRAKHGTIVRVTERDSPISDREDKRIGTVKVFEDLSEIEALRAQVREKDCLAAVGEMAATVAHEIRNPLGAVRGFAALLARDFDPEDPHGRLVEKILAGTRVLDQVVNELLEYTRPLQLRLRPTPCRDLIEAALGYIKGCGPAISFVKAIDPEAKIMADPDKMRQVFLNILLNAIQSIESEGEVRIEGAIENGTVTVAIEDTGCGMTEEQLRQVFLPFFTTKEKGTGLGLAIAAKIVEAHGGRVEADSKAGGGSRFTIYLPQAM